MSMTVSLSLSVCDTAWRMGNRVGVNYMWI